MNECEPFLTFEIRNAILEHMIEEGKNECVGLITLAKSDKYAYERHVNIHPDPENHFKFDPKIAARIVATKGVVGYVHSHPTQGIVPSKGDIFHQARVKKPCVIAGRDLTSGVVDIFSIGDHMLDYPLDGREFHYGRFDCLEAIRSEAWQREKRYMKPVPRHNDWWDPTRDDMEEEDLHMYERNFEKYGYTEFTPNLENPLDPLHPQVGDVLLMQLGSPMINHAAVYIGNNQIYHHRVDKRSGRTPVGYVIGQNQVRKWVRYEGKSDE